MPLGKISTASIVPIIGDGGIGHPDYGDGRIIPVLIVDCAEHQQLYNLILIHEVTPPGDVVVNWGHRLLEMKNVYLTLEFSQPLKTKVVLRFSLKKQAGLVDGIIKSRGVYIQPLQSASRVVDGLNKPKILVEIPPTATFPSWERLHRKTVVQTYRRQGATRTEAAELADEHLMRVTELWSKRVRPNRTKDA